MANTHVPLGQIAQSFREFRQNGLISHFSLFYIRKRLGKGNNEKGRKKSENRSVTITTVKLHKYVCMTTY